MSTVFQPPPTWALPVIIDPTTKEGVFSPIWLKWFIELSANLDSSGTSTVTTTTVLELAAFGQPRIDPAAQLAGLGNVGRQLETLTFSPPPQDFRTIQTLTGDASSILATQIFGA